MDYEEVCLNSLCGPDYQQFLENSFSKEAPKIAILGGSARKEMDCKPGEPETEPNAPTQTDVVVNVNCATEDSSTPHAKLRITFPKISKGATGDKRSNKANFRVINEKCPKDASGKETNDLQKTNSQLETQDAKTESKIEVRSMPKEEVKVHLLSRILPFVPRTRIFKKDPDVPSSKRMNNYDVESDIESIDHSKANTTSTSSANEKIVFKSTNEMNEELSLGLDKPHNESSERTEGIAMKESGLVGKEIDDLPEASDVIQRTEAKCSSTFPQASDDKIPFQVASAVMLADFINHLNDMRISMNSVFSNLTNISIESIKYSGSQGAESREQSSADMNDPYEDVQSLDADVSQPDCARKHDRPLSLARSVNLKKPNFSFPSLRIDRKQIITKLSTPLQKPAGKKGDRNALISRGVPPTPTTTSFPNRPNQLKKSFRLLIHEKTESDSNEYEYDDFADIRKEDHDYDICEDFVGESTSTHKLAGENLYYNEDVIERADSVVIEEPPPLPPKTSQLNPSDRRSKHRCEVQHCQKRRNRQGDIELPRRSISGEKGVTKGLMNFSKKFALKTPFSSSRRDGEGRGPQPTTHLKVKQGSKEARRVVIDNADVYEEEIPITRLTDFQDSNEGEYELYGDLPTTQHTENKYLELVSVKGRPLENVVQRRILPELPRPNIESTIECKRNVRCSFTKTPKPKIANDQRDSSTNFRGSYQFDESQDNPLPKALELSLNLKSPSSEKTNEVGEKMISKKIPPVIPARPESIPSHIISRLSTPLPTGTQNHSTISSSVGDEEGPSDEQMVDQITGNSNDRSVGIEVESKEKSGTSVQSDDDPSAFVCDNDVYMYMADCYSQDVNCIV
ncbi:unnamed protein product [Rodentolepis nana]|uniref:FYVE, RhoGEF and PH domain-containing protein 6 n=1 Tax=Rodentolepis nana TaxID=102285 RepID=A0A0R3TWH9_RODNA|nr:unnamed protein product [Rodentolepis nana]